MRYLLAIVLPPLAVLICGKPFQAVINCFLLLLLWVPASLHALFVVNNATADRRNNQLIRVMQGKTPNMGAGEAVAVGSRRLATLTMVAIGFVGLMVMGLGFIAIMATIGG